MLTPFGKTLSQDEQRNFGIAALCSKPVRQSMLFDCLANAMIADQLPPKTIESKTTMVSPLSAPGRSRILIVEDNRLTSW